MMPWLTSVLCEGGCGRACSFQVSDASYCDGEGFVCLIDEPRASRPRARGREGMLNPDKGDLEFLFGTLSPSFGRSMLEHPRTCGQWYRRQGRRMAGFSRCRDRRRRWPLWQILCCSWLKHRPNSISALEGPSVNLRPRTGFGIVDGEVAAFMAPKGSVGR